MSRNRKTYHLIGVAEISDGTTFRLQSEDGYPNDIEFRKKLVEEVYKYCFLENLKVENVHFFKEETRCTM